MKKEFIYKLYDEEEPEYNCLIKVNMPCGELIRDLIVIYQEKDFIDREDEEFDEQRNHLLELAKDGLSEVYEELGLDEDEFDNKAEEIVDDFIDNLDIMGNTEDYVIDTIKEIGIDVEIINVDEEIEY